jgi:DNA helicase-2/ATP-dependent DNA helicase PcrA
MSHWMDELNGAQRQAATHGEGPVLVIAGAGTGKTRTLAARVAYLIEQGVSPQSIMLLTFTRRAAAEMTTRAGQLTDRTAAGKVWGGTFHATANRLLRQYGRAVGLAPEFTVMDQGDAGDLMNLVRGELGHGDRTKKKRFPRKSTLIGIYSRMVNSRTKLTPLLEQHYPWCGEHFEGIREIFGAYTQRKRQRNVLDYDDLLLYWRALCDVPEVAADVCDRFEHVLVDEYQDTNLVQAEILQAMRRQKKNIMVVGDDAQSIYSFRAATVRNILDFPEQFPGAAVVKLEENYRSVQPILDASNAVMAHAKQRYTKHLFSRRPSEQRPGVVTSIDEAEQCNEVCDALLAKLEEGVPLTQQAVLFRAGHHSDQLEIELTRRNIPFVKFGGLKFVEAAHVKDMIALLRLLDNPQDELSWYRVLQLLEGVGPVIAQRTIGELFGHADKSPLKRLLDDPPSMPAAARSGFEAMRQALRDCSEDGSLKPAGQVERIRRFYEPIFERLYDNPKLRLRDLEQLEQIATGYRSRNAFVTDLTLDPPSSTQDLAGPPLLDEDYVILSTIHSAKGCEWDCVHIIHAADGMIPSDMATASEEEIEEERRLLYVAMTRAKNTLTLHMPLRYYFKKHRRSDRHSYAQLTRFIPEADLIHFDRRSAAGVREAMEAPSPAEGAAGTAASIDAMLGDLMSNES